ncbi:unnamed protein product [Miscanthus lutarioriparius]|uniref:Uncharacterized protein n=1 Tax=Miscanthus lutarioriparius TaxID=422564 RepID=A0A811N0J6_9POAL|nr:unnamed protein product [Miscanthus lutarioriparius]
MPRRRLRVWMRRLPLMAAACADLVRRGTHGVLSPGGTASAPEDAADGFPGGCVHRSKIETPPQCSAEALAAFPIVNGLRFASSASHSPCTRCALRYEFVTPEPKSSLLIHAQTSAQTGGRVCPSQTDPQARAYYQLSKCGGCVVHEACHSAIVVPSPAGGDDRTQKQQVDMQIYVKCGSKCFYPETAAFYNLDENAIISCLLEF